MTTTTPPASILPTRRRGWKKQGVIFVQFVIIFFFESLELFFRDKLGAITGAAVLATFIMGALKGRSGTSFTSAVNPPISFLISTLIVLPAIGGTKLAISKLLIDLVNALASIAPYLIIGAICGWAFHLKENRAEKKKSA